MNNLKLEGKYSHKLTEIKLELIRLEMDEVNKLIFDFKEEGGNLESEFITLLKGLIEALLEDWSTYMAMNTMLELANDEEIEKIELGYWEGEESSNENDMNYEELKNILRVAALEWIEERTNEI